MSIVNVFNTPARGARNGLPGWKPYVYRGTGTDTLTAWMDDGCYCAGNAAAYHVHIRNGDTPCGRSRAAHAARSRAAYERKQGQP